MADIDSGNSDHAEPGETLPDTPRAWDEILRAGIPVGQYVEYTTAERAKLLLAVRAEAPELWVRIVAVGNPSPKSVTGE